MAPRRPRCAFGRIQTTPKPKETDPKNDNQESDHQESDKRTDPNENDHQKSDHQNGDLLGGDHEETDPKKSDQQKGDLSEGDHKETESNPRSNKRSPCNEYAQRIVGHCTFCGGDFCSKHRMLEAHNCTGLEDCKKQSHDRNADKLNSERTMRPQIVF